MKRLAVATLLLAILAALPLSQAGNALVVTHDAGAPDAILMLASHEWERLPAAAALARQHPDAIVLLTEPWVITVYTCHRCSERVDWLESEGVPRDRVRMIGRAGNTYGEAVAARAYAAREPFIRLAVVTTPYHTRRTFNTFRTVFADTGIDISSVPASPPDGTPSRWWATPYDRYYVRYEWAAILKYWWDYGVPLTVRPSQSE